MQIERSSYSKRQVLRRASTNYVGERPTNGFPSLVVWEGRGIQLDWFEGFNGWFSMLEGGSGGLLG